MSREVCSSISLLHRLVFNLFLSLTGRSICMDLLLRGGFLVIGKPVFLQLLQTLSDSPICSFSSGLLCIKLAISKLDPRPARLAPNWNIPYSVSEALEGYKRAANVSCFF